MWKHTSLGICMTLFEAKQSGKIYSIFLKELIIKDRHLEEYKQEKACRNGFTCGILNLKQSWHSSM